jgi:DNA-binding CsgD family transcriptional regulator
MDDKGAAQPTKGDGNVNLPDLVPVRERHTANPEGLELVVPIRVGVIHPRDIYRRGLRGVIEQAPDLSLEFVSDRLPGRESWPAVDVALVSARLMEDKAFGPSFRRYVQAGAGHLLLWESRESGDSRSWPWLEGVLCLQASCSGRLVAAYIRMVAAGAVTSFHASPRTTAGPVMMSSPPGGAEPPRSMQIISQLGPRDRIILRRIAHGQTNGEMGRDLYLAESTVKKHVHRLLSTLGCARRAQAAAYYARYEAQYQAPGETGPHTV